MSIIPSSSPQFSSVIFAEIIIGVASETSKVSIPEHPPASVTDTV